MGHGDSLPEESTTPLERAQWDFDRAVLRHQEAQALVDERVKDIQRKIEQLLVPYSMDIYLLKYRLKMWRQRCHRRMNLKSFRIRFSDYETASVRWSHARATRWLERNQTDGASVEFCPKDVDLAELLHNIFMLIAIMAMVCLVVGALGALTTLPKPQPPDEDAFTHHYFRSVRHFRPARPHHRATPTTVWDTLPPDIAPTDTVVEGLAHLVHNRQPTQP